MATARFSSAFFSNGRIQRDVQLIRNHLGNAIGIAITPTQHPAHVAHDAFRLKFAKRDDLRDSAFTVFLYGRIPGLPRGALRRNPRRCPEAKRDPDLEIARKSVRTEADRCR